MVTVVTALANASEERRAKAGAQLKTKLMPCHCTGPRSSSPPISTIVTMISMRYRHMPYLER